MGWVGRIERLGRARRLAIRMDFTTAASQRNAVLLSYDLSVIVLPLFALYVLYMFPKMHTI